MFINLTPHDIVLNNGTIIKKEADTPIARVSSCYTEFDGNGICKVQFGEVENLPEPQEGVFYIVSAMVMARVPHRTDVVAPATGHPDCIRENGRIVSVPGFIGN